MNYNKLSTESKKIIKFLQTEKFDVGHKLNKTTIKIIKKYYNQLQNYIIHTVKVILLFLKFYIKKRTMKYHKC